MLTTVGRVLLLICIADLLDKAATGCDREDAQIVCAGIRGAGDAIVALFGLAQTRSTLAGVVLGAAVAIVTRLPVDASVGWCRSISDRHAIFLGSGVGRWKGYLIKPHSVRGWELVKAIPLCGVPTTGCKYETQKHRASKHPCSPRRLSLGFFGAPFSAHGFAP
jgi:hypothetical protein